MNTWQFNKVAPASPSSAGGQLPLTGNLTDAAIEEKLAIRNEARRLKDFKRSDDIRTELSNMGITIEDRPDGTSRWKR